MHARQAAKRAYGQAKDDAAAAEEAVEMALAAVEPGFDGEVYFKARKTW